MTVLHKVGTPDFVKDSLPVSSRDGSKNVKKVENRGY
jgi:hypothetical protein